MSPNIAVPNQLVVYRRNYWTATTTPSCVVGWFTLKESNELCRLCHRKLLRVLDDLCFGAGNHRHDDLLFVVWMLKILYDKFNTLIYNKNISVFCTFILAVSTSAFLTMVKLQGLDIASNATSTALLEEAASTYKVIGTVTEYMLYSLLLVTIVNPLSFLPNQPKASFDKTK